MDRPEIPKRRHTAGQRLGGCCLGLVCGYIATVVSITLADWRGFEGPEDAMMWAYFGTYIVMPLLALLGILFGPRIWRAIVSRYRSSKTDGGASR